jgi:hypothetical protein
MLLIRNLAFFLQHKRLRVTPDSTQFTEKNQLILLEKIYQTIFPHSRENFELFSGVF